MLTIRRFPLAFPPISAMQREFDALFDNFVSGAAPRPQFPALNVWEEDARFVVEAEVPGFQLTELDITVQGDVLMLKGTRTASGQTEDANFLRQERVIREFARTLTMPATVDVEKIEATLHAGVLTISLPKAATAQPRKVLVQGT